jgi:RHS repeat-associated protein
MGFDTETGLYHTWFRQYDKTQGRWMSVDPLAGDIANPQSLNRYAYVLNDPINLFDPLGLAGCGGAAGFRSAEAQEAFCGGGGASSRGSGNCTEDGVISLCNSFLSPWSQEAYGNYANAHDSIAAWVADRISASDKWSFFEAQEFAALFGYQLTRGPAPKEFTLIRRGELGNIWYLSYSPLKYGIVERQRIGCRLNPSSCLRGLSGVTTPAQSSFHTGEYWSCVASELLDIEKTIAPAIFGGVFGKKVLAKFHPVGTAAIVGVFLLGRAGQIRTPCMREAYHP